MTKQVQWRRGTTAEMDTFTGAVGEVAVDTDQGVMRVHDGAVAGGHAQMRGALATVAALRAQSKRPAAVLVLGGAAIGDGGGGVFRWNSVSAAEDDGINVVKPTAQAGNGRYLRVGLVRLDDIGDLAGLDTIYAAIDHTHDYSELTGTPPEGGGGGGDVPYVVGAFWDTVIPASKRLVKHVFPIGVTFPADFVGSYWQADDDPTGTPDVLIKRDVGGTISTTGTIHLSGSDYTITSAGGGTIHYDAGDVLIVEGPASPDATLANVCASLVGARDA